MQTVNMAPINPNLQIESQSMETAAKPEFQTPISPKTTELSKKSKSDAELGQRWRDSEEEKCSGRERLKRHRVEVAGRVWIPEMWGQEDFLKDWIDSTVFDAAVRNSGIMSARASLMEEGRRRRDNSTRFRIQNRC